MLRPLHNNIVFVFYDEVRKGVFHDKTEGGLLYVDNSESAKKARWGKVLALGPEVCDQIEIGDDILIEPLMWTLGMDYDGVRLWRTDETKVMAVR